MNSSDSIGPHLGAQDRAAWVQIALNPAGMSASFGWHELHENPSRQPVDCHKITGRRCILVEESMIQPSRVARACSAAINSRSVVLAMKKRQTARVIAKVQIRHLLKIGNDLDLATFAIQVTQECVSSMKKGVQWRDPPEPTMTMKRIQRRTGPTRR